jgi:hypothetical protein
VRFLRFLTVFGLILCGVCGASPAYAQDAASAFIVNNVSVDVVGKSTDEARLAAYREAQRRAWPRLWSRMTGKPAAEAPKMGDPALDSMVAGIEVEAERFSLTRYIGRLSVVFDRVRAGKYLGGGGTVLASPPMLLLAVLHDGGTSTVYESRSPWLRAWARYRAGATPIQYVRASNMMADAVLLNAYQARRDNRAIWRNILNRFRAADVLTAEAKLDRSYPGGPVVGTFTARHGPDATVIARFRLRAGTAAELDQMLDEGVRRVDSAYAFALRNGQLRTDPELTADLAPVAGGSPTIAMAAPVVGVEADVATPDAASWASLESAIRSTPTVRGVTLLSLSLGGTSRIRIGHSETYDWLLYHLDQRGLRLEPGAAAPRLRRKLPGDAPVARPLTAEEIEAIQAAGAAGTPAGIPVGTPLGPPVGTPPGPPVGSPAQGNAPAPAQPPRPAGTGPVELPPQRPS